MAARQSLFVKVSILCPTSKPSYIILQKDPRFYKEEGKEGGNFRHNKNIGEFKSSFNPIGHSEDL